MRNIEMESVLLQVMMVVQGDLFTLSEELARRMKCKERPLLVDIDSALKLLVKESLATSADRVMQCGLGVRGARVYHLTPLGREVAKKARESWEKPEANPPYYAAGPWLTDEPLKDGTKILAIWSGEDPCVTRWIPTRGTWNIPSRSQGISTDPAYWTRINHPTGGSNYGRT